MNMRDRRPLDTGRAEKTTLTATVWPSAGSPGAQSTVCCFFSRRVFALQQPVTRATWKRVLPQVGTPTDGQLCCAGGNNILHPQARRSLALHSAQQDPDNRLDGCFSRISADVLGEQIRQRFTQHHGNAVSFLSGT